MLQKGEVLNDRYKVDSVIGKGGMSTVYLVEDLTLESRWAMKETLDILPDLNSSEIYDQFKREAKILAGLSHPGLPRVIDYFAVGQRHYLVEEYIKGEPSEDVLSNSQKFDEHRILNWALQICDLLEFLHQNGIIYRDLKPGNIMIDEDEKVYLVDFGIARFFQGGRSRDTVIIGTPGFASPEHYGRGQTDARSDIFSLGATLHYMMTAKDPADSPFHFDIPYLINGQVSFESSSIIMKCLDLDPVRRYQSALQVREAIERRAIPALKNVTRPLAPPPNTPINEKYKNSTDLMGKTARFLSYTSVFPASMTISGALAFGFSMLNPILGFAAGAASFPVLCIEFWKRMDQAFRDQEATIKVSTEGISFSSGNLNLETTWPEITSLYVVKNRDWISIRKIKKVKVISRAGEFSFDASYGDYRRLLDIIITRSGLVLTEEGDEVYFYRKP